MGFGLSATIWHSFNVMWSGMCMLARLRWVSLSPPAMIRHKLASSASTTLASVVSQLLRLRFISYKVRHISCWMIVSVISTIWTSRRYAFSRCSLMILTWFCKNAQRVGTSFGWCRLMSERLSSINLVKLDSLSCSKRDIVSLGWILRSWSEIILILCFIGFVGFGRDFFWLVVALVPGLSGEGAWLSWSATLRAVESATSASVGYLSAFPGGTGVA